MTSPEATDRQARGAPSLRANIMLAAVRGAMAARDSLATARAVGQRPDIYDTCALTGKNVGIVMDTGTDTAMRTSPLTPVEVYQRGIATAAALWVATVAFMNLILTSASVYSAVGLPLADGLLHSITRGLLAPRVAAIDHL